MNEDTGIHAFYFNFLAHYSECTHIFDPVGSFYWPGNKTALNLNLAHASAGTVVQLSAHHEIRKNFPLTSIMGHSGLASSAEIPITAGVVHAH